MPWRSTLFEGVQKGCFLGYWQSEYALLACRSQGCPDKRCHLCRQNPRRFCNGDFSRKYLMGDVLKASCDAPIQMKIVSRVSGEAPAARELGELYLEVGHSLIV